MVDNKDLTVNFLPSPTWNRLGVNQAKIRNIPVDGWNSIPVQKEIIEKYINNSDSEIWDSFANIQTGMGEEIDEISKISQSEKIRISADKTKSEKLFFNCKNGENAFADVELIRSRKHRTYRVYDNAVSVECKRYLCRKNEI